MEKGCSVPMDLVRVKGGLNYKRCGKEAVKKVKNSNWYICKDHIHYAKSQGWELESLNKD